MAKCSISIDFSSPADQLVAQAQSAITGAGGQFSGNMQNGSFSISTPLGSVKGLYRIATQQINIDITDKPMFVSCDRIESELRKYLR
jgi:hypothetical protein